MGLGLHPVAPTDPGPPGRSATGSPPCRRGGVAALGLTLSARWATGTSPSMSGPLYRRLGWNNVGSRLLIDKPLHFELKHRFIRGGEWTWEVRGGSGLRCKKGRPHSIASFKHLK